MRRVIGLALGLLVGCSRSPEQLKKEHEATVAQWDAEDRLAEYRARLELCRACDAHLVSFDAKEREFIVEIANPSKTKVVRCYFAPKVKELKDQHGNRYHTWTVRVHGKDGLNIYPGDKIGCVYSFDRLIKDDGISVRLELADADASRTLIWDIVVESGKGRIDAKWVNHNS